MVLGCYPGWYTGLVRDYLNRLRDDGQRKKAAAKLDFDLHVLETTWPRTQFVTVKSMKGHEPLHELSREYQLTFRLSRAGLSRISSDGGPHVSQAKLHPQKPHLPIVEGAKLPQRLLTLPVG